MPDKPQTMGDYLRAARRRRRIGLERAADETRIRPDFIMRMESDEFDFLAPAYVRGFLRNYARFLNVDPEPLLEEFDRRFGSGRVDTAQILAAERQTKRRKHRERPKISPWLVAATLAAGILALLTVIGLANPPQEQAGRDRPVSQNDRRQKEDKSKPAESPTSSPTRSARPTRTPTSEPTIALTDGMTVEIVATRGDCWVTVTADGVEVYTSTPSLAVGESAGPFTADQSMSIVLGNAYAVDLIVNGQELGPVGGEGEVVTVTLPDDAEALL